MAIDRAKEGREKAKKLRAERNKKSKAKAKKTFKGLSKWAKSVGIGVGKEEWEKGKEERQAKRKSKAKARREEAAKRRAEIKKRNEKRKSPLTKTKDDKKTVGEKGVKKAGSVKTVGEKGVKKAAPKKKPTQSFGEAFAAARKEKGAGKTFMWKGKSYSTNRADDVKKDAPKVDNNTDYSGDSMTEKEYYEGVSEERKYSHGGKVESSSNGGGLFNWPSTDARKR